LNGQYAIAQKFHNSLYVFGWEMRYRFSDRFILTLDLNKASEKNQLGYAFEREMNGDPIVGFRDNTAFTSVLTGIYHFTPRMNINLRARHYWNKVLYKSFHNVDASGKLIQSSFSGNKDENVNIFNFDAFINWDFRL